MKQLLYFASGNKQKLERMQKICSSISEDLMVEQVPQLVEVEEDGTTPAENARQKIRPYVGNDYGVPIIAGDTAIYFEGIHFDPTTVKRQALQELEKTGENISQDEVYDAMLEYYKTLAKDKGGSFPFNYVDAWAVLFPDGSIKDFEYERHYIMTDTPHGPKQLYFPMCNLYRSMITGKYFTDWDEHDFYKEFAHQREGLKYVLDL